MNELSKAIVHFEHIIDYEINTFPETKRVTEWINDWKNDPCFDLHNLPYKFDTEDPDNEDPELFGKENEKQARYSLRRIQEKHEIIGALKYAQKMVKDAEAFRSVLEIIVEIKNANS